MVQRIKKRTPHCAYKIYGVMIMEKWKDVFGYEGLYQVSDAGRVRSLDINRVDKLGRKLKKKGRILKGIEVMGYLKVNLWKGGVMKIHAVHRLVAIAFIPNPEGKPQINHKDGNKENNHVSNLEWCTHSENTRHAYDNDLIKRMTGTKNHMTKISECDVLKIREMHKTGKYRHKDLAEIFGVSRRHIGDIVNKKRWAHLK